MRRKPEWRTVDAFPSWFSAAPGARRLNFALPDRPATSKARPLHPALLSYPSSSALSVVDLLVNSLAMFSRAVRPAVKAGSAAVTR